MFCTLVVKVYGLPTGLDPVAGLSTAPSPTTAVAELSWNPVKKMLSLSDGLVVFTWMEVSPL